ncbi:hypothetical protein [Dokdonella sp.]|uniref:hypothetical protein n=1 Tax=Dokdonella sp. TaxID=2291710 RepID=UPI001B219A4F|nr:hypothetical protein [Dokdonella sp.]MBO9662942.1 hypothetical protein [Dokdonella sp.]
MIYPTRAGGETWAIGEDPNHDDRFITQGTLARNSDGSWRFENDAENAKVRMSVTTSAGYHQNQVVTDHAALAERGYMQSPRDWKNVEITGYVRVTDVSNTGDEITWYARGGKHSNPQPFCEGVAYKGDLKFSGRVRFAKEPWHVNYYFRPGDGVPATRSILGRWVGFKTVMYDTDAGVHLELWVDGEGDGHWTQALATDDVGGWGSDEVYCNAPEAIPITWGGPLATFRWDNVRKISFKHLSVREIEPNDDTIFREGFDP